MLWDMFDNGILPSVPGQYLATALNTLPPAHSATADSMDATIDVPGIGTVRVTAKRVKSKRGRAVQHFWTPEKAELVK